MTEITQTSYETETGTTFVQIFPKGVRNPHVEEVVVTHITNWRKMMNLLDKVSL